MSGEGVSRSVTRIGVDVTFLEMRQPLPHSPAPMPDGWCLRRELHPHVDDYLALYRQVGAPWCWWMRLEMDRRALAAHLARDETEVFVLSDRSGRHSGFFEIDRRLPDEPYLCYLGLVPDALGQGLGRPLLEAAVQCGWAPPCRVLRVNTCTADHERALPAYRRVGFDVVRTTHEVWDVPDDLGVTVPARLRVA